MASNTEKLIYAKTRLLEKFRSAGKRALGPRKRLPPGQHLTKGFPVLDLGIRPAFDAATWRLAVDGEVAAPLNLSWDEFRALPKATQVSDFHCVTTWSKYDVTWSGVNFRTLVERVRPSRDAAFLMQTCADGYTTNLPLKELQGDDVLLAYELEGKPLPLEHGGPMRLIVPQLYAWKSAKFLNRLTFLVLDEPGYWERLGYHNVGDPWTEERFR